MSASLSPFALMPDVPMRTVSAAPVPLTEIVSRWDGDSPPDIRSISNSISDVPVPSAVAPGAKPPLARSIRAPWPPSAPVTAILSVFATVAVPHCTPSTSIWPPAVRAIVAASAAPVIVTEAVPELNVQVDGGACPRSAEQEPGEEREDKRGGADNACPGVVPDLICHGSSVSRGKWESGGPNLRRRAYQPLIAVRACVVPSR